MALYPSPGLLPGPLLPSAPKPTAERLYRRWESITDGDAEAGYPLFALAEAFAHGTVGLEEIVRGDRDRPPWARAVDVDQAPLWVLPWLGCLVGVEWNGDASERLRLLIRTRPRHKRGTPGAIRQAVLDTLDASATLADVRLYARAGGPWHDYLVVTASRTPNESITEDAALAEKPWGRRLDVVFTDEPIIEDWTLTIDAVSVDINDLTIDDVT